MPLPRRTIMTSTCLAPAHMHVYTLLWEGHAPPPRTDHVGAGGRGPGFVRLSVTGGLLVPENEFSHPGSGPTRVASSLRQPDQVAPGTREDTGCSRWPTGRPADRGLLIHAGTRKPP